MHAATATATARIGTTTSTVRGSGPTRVVLAMQKEDFGRTKSVKKNLRISES